MQGTKVQGRNKGITLIALVVTIIVLLILAGVSIQMIAGQSGILKNAQQAREETIKGQIRDDVRREIMEKMTKNLGDISSADLYEILNKYFDLTKSGEGENIVVVKEPDKYTEEETNPWEADNFPENFPELHSREGNYSFKLGDLYSGGLSGGETTPPTPPTPPTQTEETVTPEKLNEYQGKYVDIGLDIVGDTKTTDDWKIFYVGGADEDNSEGEEEGRIFLIAADYVPSEKISSGVLTAAGLSTSGTYNVYWPSSPNFNSSSELSQGSSFMKLVKHTGYNLNSNNPNSKAVSQLLNTAEWNKVVASAGKKDNIEFCIGGPTLEMWCAAWNASNAAKEGFTNVYANGGGSSGYYVGANKSAQTYNYYVNGKGSAFTADEQNTINSRYKTFFPHTGSSAYDGCYGYWLASHSANNSSYLMNVYYSGRVNNLNYYSSYCCVRPVVCLKSGVQLQKDEDESKGGTTVYDLVVSKY